MGEEKKKLVWKGGNMLYPVPAVIVSCADRNGESNLFTVAWTGTVCTNPPMLSISVRPERYSYHMLKETGEFVVNMTTEKLVRAADFCGVRSGRDMDKWEKCGLTRQEAAKVSVPLIAESPVNIECRVREVIPLGSHDLFLADVLAVNVDPDLLDAKEKLCLETAKPAVYSHGEYYGLGKLLGTFGYSVKKKGNGRKKKGGR